MHWRPGLWSKMSHRVVARLATMTAGVDAGWRGAVVDALARWPRGDGM